MKILIQKMKNYKVNQKKSFFLEQIQLEIQKINRIDKINQLNIFKLMNKKKKNNQLMDVFMLYQLFSLEIQVYIQLNKVNKKISSQKKMYFQNGKLNVMIMKQQFLNQLLIQIFIFKFSLLIKSIQHKGVIIKVLIIKLFYYQNQDIIILVFRKLNETIIKIQLQKQFNFFNKQISTFTFFEL
ncbi:unnamed protein product [Paramecium sonneborni]|uniref:Uncharacterized protein n=1 Tax=Paramecium sonneborni TaxID=65129 RepID=A0A8S1M1A3_9CILI|nr:unnamed protein product [Paramecium sonneborni]